MLAGHSLVLGALPSSTSSSSGEGTPVTVVASTPSSPTRGTDNVTRLGALSFASTPSRLRRESEEALKFLTLGLMGNTRAFSDPL